MKRLFQQISQTFSHTPKIKFTCREELLDAIPHPVPAAKAMPEWFKAISRDIPNQDLTKSGTIKRCIPVLDAVSQGYIIPLWSDLHVSVCWAYKLYDEEGNLIAEVKDLQEDPDEAVGKNFNGQKVGRVERTQKYLWCKLPNGFDTGAGGDIERHGWQQVGELCDLKKYDLGRVLLKFANPWVIETPKGWSVQFKNPANNWSNEIQLLEGVVDTDTYHQQVNFPYVWTGSEIGEWIIPKGTPLVQVIPFKREKTKLEVGSYDLEKIAKTNAKLSSVFFDRYRRYYWHKGKSNEV